MGLTDFRLSQWFIVDVDSACGSLHYVDVGSVANLSEEHASSRQHDKLPQLTDTYSA
jgi:hypothetical protein